MTGPANRRPTSLARLRAVPVGDRVLDRAGESWTRETDGWRHSRTWETASTTALHRLHRPLWHIPNRGH